MTAFKKDPSSEIRFSAEGLLLYCDAYQHDIFIRTFDSIDETYKATSLSDLSGSRLIELLVKWTEEQRYPTRVFRPESNLVDRKKNLPHE